MIQHYYTKWKQFSLSVFHNIYLVTMPPDSAKPADHPFRRALLIGFQEVYMKERKSIYLSSGI